MNLNIYFFCCCQRSGLQCKLLEHSSANTIFSLIVLKKPQSIQPASQQILKLKTSISTKKKMLTEVSHVRSFTHTYIIYTPNHRRPTELNCALLFKCSSICSCHFCFTYMHEKCTTDKIQYRKNEFCLFLLYKCFIQMR